MQADDRGSNGSPVSSFTYEFNGRSSEKRVNAPLDPYNQSRSENQQTIAFWSKPPGEESRGNDHCERKQEPGQKVTDGSIQKVAAWL